MFDLFEEIDDLELEHEMLFLAEVEEEPCQDETLDVYDQMLQGGIGVFFSDDE